MRAYRQGATLEQVADRYGIVWITAYRRIRRAAPWIIRPKGNPPATEPSERDRKVLESRRAGMTLAEIGELEGISHQRVHQILKRWRYAE